MKNFIALGSNSNSMYGWEIIGKFEKLTQALDCTARFWKKSNGKARAKIIDKKAQEVVYFKNKEILRRAITPSEIKKFL